MVFSGGGQPVADSTLMPASQPPQPLFPHSFHTGPDNPHRRSCLVKLLERFQSSPEVSFSSFLHGFIVKMQSILFIAVIHCTAWLGITLPLSLPSGADSLCFSSSITCSHAFLFCPMADPISFCQRESMATTNLDPGQTRLSLCVCIWCHRIQTSHDGVPRSCPFHTPIHTDLF